ncbi:hypothetical protein AO501_20235 [Mycobacterium gordonae]|uniref:Uncharacterized protein n=1 Tax=Mycobacterium gordonae TaxID=1778 RepID=A0A0Q2XI42_MYCGO|nr:hypothetical protein AO501_20235 [Mycobacterium gordonae]
MAETSRAHISSYAASVAAIAGAFCPNRFDNTSDTKPERFAATSAGWTTAECTASNSATIAAA